MVERDLDVVLHPDVDHVAGRADEAADGAGQPGQRHSLDEGDILAVGRHHLFGRLEKDEIKSFKTRLKLQIASG